MESRMIEEYKLESKLIEAVRVRRVLYDHKHKDYIKNRLKAEKWEELAKETGIGSGAEAKEMWMKLRHSLRDALRRQQKCLQSGLPPCKQWKYQEQMSFLLPHMSCNKAGEYSVNEDTDDRETPSQNCEIDTPPTEAVGEREESLDTQQGIISARDEAQPPALPEISPAPEAPKSAKIVKKNILADLLKRGTEQHKERKKSRSEERKRKFEQTSVPGHSLYHFFMSMYESTKHMPPSSQFAVKNGIFRVVSEVEATLLNIPTKTSHCNTAQWPSYNELPPHNNQAANQSYDSSSSSDHSSHSDSPLANLK